MSGDDRVSQARKVAAENAAALQRYAQDKIAADAITRVNTVIEQMASAARIEIARRFADARWRLLRPLDAEIRLRRVEREEDELTACFRSRRGLLPGWMWGGNDGLA